MTKEYPYDHCPDCGGRNLSRPDFEGFLDCFDCGAAWIPDYDVRPVTMLKRVKF